MAEKKSANLWVPLPGRDAKVAIIYLWEVDHVLEDTGESVGSLLDVSVSEKVL
jgi:hypothetical protein